MSHADLGSAKFLQQENTRITERDAYARFRVIHLVTFSRRYQDIQSCTKREVISYSQNISSWIFSREKAETKHATRRSRFPIRVDFYVL